MKPTKPERICVSIPEAARALGVSPGTIRNLILSDELQSIKIRSRRLIPVRSLEAMVERECELDDVADSHTIAHDSSLPSGSEDGKIKHENRRQ